MVNNPMLKLTDYIVVIPNSISSELCDAIINEYSEDEYREAELGSNKVEKEIRNCQVIAMSHSSSINRNNLVRKKIDNDLFDVFNKVILQYIAKHPNVTVEDDVGYDLLRYNLGGFYTEHTDSYKSNPRAITCSIIINDDFEGGEFSFFDNTLSYKLRKGDAIMFPSNFMYPHAVQPVTKGIRYSIVTWFI